MVVQIMIIQFIYFFVLKITNIKSKDFESVRICKVLKESFGDFVLFIYLSRVFKVSFTLCKTFQFRKLFLIVPNFPHHFFFLRTLRSPIGMYQFFFLNSSNGGGVMARYGKPVSSIQRIFSIIRQSRGGVMAKSQDCATCPNMSTTPNTKTLGQIVTITSKKSHFSIASGTY